MNMIYDRVIALHRIASHIVDFSAAGKTFDGQFFCQVQPKWPLYK